MASGRALTSRQREIYEFIFRSTKRIVVFVVGVALFVLGIALIPLPGPFSIPLMIAGLAVLLACVFVVVRRLTAKAPPAAPFITMPPAAEPEPVALPPPSEPTPLAELPPPPPPPLPEPEVRLRVGKPKPPKQRCNPPTYLDDKGLKRYKPGCLK